MEDPDGFEKRLERWTKKVEERQIQLMSDMGDLLLAFFKFLWKYRWRVAIGLVFYYLIGMTVVSFIHHQ